MSVDIAWSSFSRIEHTPGGIDDVVLQAELPAGDIIFLDDSQKVASDEIEITLSTARDVTWWKGLEVYDWRNHKIAFAYTQDDNHGPVSATIHTHGVDLKRVKIDFLKAKLLGIHTGMYTVHDLSEMSGKRLNFTWTRDP